MESCINPMDYCRWIKEFIYIIGRDNTDLENSKDLLNKTFDRITDAFVALDTNLCYTYMNKKLEKFLK
jgi:hypothetical protein